MEGESEGEARLAAARAALERAGNAVAEREAALGAACDALASLREVPVRRWGLLVDVGTLWCIVSFAGSSIREWRSGDSFTAASQAAILVGLIVALAWYRTRKERRRIQAIERLANEINPARDGRLEVRVETEEVDLRREDPERRRDA